MYTTHRYSLALHDDGDYIVLESWEWPGGPVTPTEAHWVEHTRWLIPGTWLED